MRVTAISDIHGNLIDIPQCDILLICGDISPVIIQKDYIQMTNWFFNDFYKWIMNLPCDRVIMIPGNHDFWIEKFIKQPRMYLWDKLTILVDSDANIYDDINHKWYKIYGTPQCKSFGKWAYMPGDSKLEELYSNMPEDVDILITHDAPNIGKIGNILEYNGEDVSNKYLGDEIKTKKPKYVLCGHIHSGDHELKEIEGIRCANVSILDESYSINYKPLTFNI